MGINSVVASGEASLASPPHLQASAAASDTILHCPASWPEETTAKQRWKLEHYARELKAASSKECSLSPRPWFLEGQRRVEGSLQESTEA
jgi:hypothetical protein